MMGGAPIPRSRGLRRARVLRPAVLAVVLVVLSSCTGAPPEATRAELTRVYVDDLEVDRSYESLSVSVHVQDADGIDDIATLHIAHDASGLVWTAESGEWSRETVDGLDVFVVTGLVTPDGTPLPRGSYRVIATDEAGYSAEVSTRLSASPGSPEELVYPSLRVSGDTLSVAGPFPMVALRAVDGEGRIVGELRLAGGERRTISDIPWLSGSGGGLRIYLSAVDQASGLQVTRGPYRR